MGFQITLSWNTRMPAHSRIRIDVLINRTIMIMNRCQTHLRWPTFHPWHHSDHDREDVLKQVLHFNRIWSVLLFYRYICLHTNNPKSTQQSMLCWPNIFRSFIYFRQIYTTSRSCLPWFGDWRYQFSVSWVKMLGAKSLKASYCTWTTGRYRGTRLFKNAAESRNCWPHLDQVWVNCTHLVGFNRH